MYKFRTMTKGKNRNGEMLPDELRLTKRGKFRLIVNEIPKENNHA